MRENKKNERKKFMKLKQFVCKAASIAMCAMIIGTTVVSVNVKGRYENNRKYSSTRYT